MKSYKTIKAIVKWQLVFTNKCFDEEATNK